MEKIIFGCQWLLITISQLLIWGIITLILFVLIQTIVYRTTKISLFNKLMNKLFN
jgi:hypothetical protein